MAYSSTIPFFGFKLRFLSGGNIVFPLSDPEAVQLNTSVRQLAAKYEQRFQKEVLNKGDYQKLLEEYRKGDFLKNRLQVSFPASSQKDGYPAFELEFDYYVNVQAQGLAGIIPVLAVEAIADQEEQLEQHLREAVRLEFARSKRLGQLQKVVATLWFDQVELQREELHLKFLTPGELEKLEEESDQDWLSAVGTPLKIKETVCFGRQKELDQLIRAAKSPYQRNILVVGPSGVGKTALIWELARIAPSRGIPQSIWETTASALIKELTKDTGWQDNLSYLVKDLQNRNAILYVRNLMELFEVGQYEGNEVSVASFMLAYIKRGELTLLAECTPEERARIELRNPSYLANFHVFNLEEPQEDLVDIIVKKVKKIAGKQDVKIRKEAIEEVIRLNRRFSPYAGFPGKPIRFLESILINKSGLKQKDEKASQTPVLKRNEIIQYFCQDSGMPLFMVDPDIPFDLNESYGYFARNIFGQEKAVRGLVNLLASVKTGLTRSGKPIASFLFVGPTGVGKTELAKVLAQYMFGSRERMLRFDMSEFSNSYSVTRLTGEHYYASGLLTSAVRREPFSVLLFDEIEKAHPDFYDLLLQMLGEGRLTDSRGKIVNFCSTIIIMTSNIGAQTLHGGRVQLSGRQTPDFSWVSEHFLQAVEKHFRPELFNRIDEVTPFMPLTPEIVRKVVEREINILKAKEGIRFRKMNLQLEPEVLDYLAQKGYDLSYGARHLQRTIRDLLIIPLAKALNREDPDDQLEVRVAIKEQQLFIQVEANPMGLDLMLEELKRINLTDTTSQLRRNIGRLKEGHFFVQMLNELSMMEGEQKRLGSKFWNNAKKSKKYSDYLQLKQAYEEHEQGIISIEKQLSLACLDMTDFAPEAEEKVKKWKKEYQDLKITTYRSARPKHDQCHLGIYGSTIQEILGFYLNFLDRKAFSYSAEAVWYRSSYYNEWVEDASDNTGKKKRADYIRTPWEPGTKEWKFQPEQNGDLLCGIELEVTGPAVFPYLKSENGIHQWNDKEGKEFLFLVKVLNKSAEAPENLHRKETYTEGSARRVITPHHFRDKLLKINEPVNRVDDLVSILTQSLDRNFELRINGMLT
jgi:ATP-dependent Clp protease ATP-binding subunit ClpA